MRKRESLIERGRPLDLEVITVITRQADGLLTHCFKASGAAAFSRMFILCEGRMTICTRMAIPK